MSPDGRRGRDAFAEAAFAYPAEWRITLSVGQQDSPANDHDRLTEFTNYGARRRRLARFTEEQRGDEVHLTALKDHERGRYC